MYMLSCPRVDELQFPRMQALAFQSFLRRRSSIEAVSQQRMPDACHMDPDLMGSSRLQSAAHMGIAIVPCQNFPVSNCRSAVSLDNCHPLTVNRVSSDGAVNRSACFLQSSPYHRFIYAGQTAICQLRGECLMSKIILGDDQQP